MKYETLGLRLSAVVLCLPGLWASAAFAQEEALIEAKEVVVSSTRLPDSPIEARELPAIVSVITSEDI